MDFASANRAAFAVLLVAVALGTSWLAGALLVPETAPLRPAFPIARSDAPGAALPPGDALHGAALAHAVCSRCHDFTPAAQESAGPESAGPGLFSVFGRPIGRQPGYSYSDSLRAHGGNWDEAALDRWLYRPSSFAPGTRMSFRGLPAPSDRADIIAWLRTLR